MKDFLDYVEENKNLRFYLLIDAAKEHRLIRKWLRSDKSKNVINLFQNTIDRNAPDEFSPLILSYESLDMTQDTVGAWLENKRILNIISTELEPEYFVQHLQSYLTVRLPNNKNALFRFYDPVVAEKFTKFLDVNNYNILMNPVSSWWVVNIHNTLIQLPTYQ